MRESWIIQEGPESMAKYPYETQKKRQRERGEGHVRMEAGTGVMQPQPRNTWSHQELGKTKKDCPLAPSEERSLDCRLRVSRTAREQTSLL